MQGPQLFKHPSGERCATLFFLQALSRSMGNSLGPTPYFSWLWWRGEKNLSFFSTRLKVVISCSFLSSRPQGSRLEVEVGR